MIDLADALMQHSKNIADWKDSSKLLALVLFVLAFVLSHDAPIERGGPVLGAATR